MSITAKPASKAEMIRRAKENDPSLTERDLMNRFDANSAQVKQALASKGPPLKKGLRR